MSVAIHRYGPVKLQEWNVASATVIAKGDMLWNNSGEVKPASDFTWDTNLATTQASFVNLFVGIAVESSAAGSTEPVSVDMDPTSVWEYDQASATVVNGAAVGPAKASGNALENQKVVGSTGTSSCGRVFQGGTSLTRVQCTFASAYSTAANNVNSVVG